MTYLENDQCVENCIDTFWENDNEDDPICSPCDSNCVLCEGSATTCTTCEEGKYLNNERCFDCP